MQSMRLRAKMLRVTAPADAMDVVGTGGDGKGSLNISTCAALIVAGAGVPVAKQGGRAQSSRCGAADVLQALGVEVELTPEAVSRCIADAGIGFMLAPRHHPALKHVSPIRIELGVRTVFNLVSTMLNPAGVRRQLVGVFAERWVTPVAQILGEVGSDRAMVVHASDGHDEITTTGPTLVASLEGGHVRTFTVSPEDVGIRRASPDALRGSDARGNAAAIAPSLAGRARTVSRYVALASSTRRLRSWSRDAPRTCVKASRSPPTRSTPVKPSAGSIYWWPFPSRARPRRRSRCKSRKPRRHPAPVMDGSP